MAQPHVVFRCYNCNSQAMGVPGQAVSCPFCNATVQVPAQEYQAHGGAGGGGNEPFSHEPHGRAPVRPQTGSVQPGYSSSSSTFWYNDKMPSSKGDAHETIEGQQGEWTTSLLTACFSQPLWCMFGCLCCPCAVWCQRRKLLMADRSFDNWKYYHCCAGICGECCTKCCDPFTGCCPCWSCCCAVLESWCCTTCAAHGNRYMVMLHYGLQNTCCDLIIFWISCCCSLLACITGDDTLQLCADLIWCSVLGCMAAQHENEMVVKGYPMN